MSIWSAMDASFIIEVFVGGEQLSETTCVGESPAVGVGGWW